MSEFTGENVLTNQYFIQFKPVMEMNAYLAGEKAYAYSGQVVGEAANGWFLIGIFGDAGTVFVQQKVVSVEEFATCEFFHFESRFIEARRAANPVKLSRLPRLEKDQDQPAPRFQIPDFEMQYERHPAVADTRQIGAEMIASLESKNFGTVRFNPERDSIDFFVSKDSTKERYWIPMSYVLTPPEVVGQIYQISGKNWFSVEVLRDFFKLLDAFGLKDVPPASGENNVQQ